MCKGTITFEHPASAIKAATRRRPKHVRFGYVHCRKFNNRLTKEDKRAIWYNGRDLRDMNRQVHYDLKQVRRCGFNPYYEHEKSFRGLEPLVAGRPDARLMKRRQFVRSIVYYHREGGMTDPDELGAFASSYSYYDQMTANEFGDYDAHQAAQVYQEDAKWSAQDKEQYREFCDIPRSNSMGPAREKRIIAASSA